MEMSITEAPTTSPSSAPSIEQSKNESTVDRIGSGAGFIDVTGGLADYKGKGANNRFSAGRGRLGPGAIKRNGKGGKGKKRGKMIGKGRRHL